MRYTGTPIWQDVAVPCVTLPDPWPWTLPVTAMAKRKAPVSWQEIRDEWESYGFRLWSDGTLEAIGD